MALFLYNANLNSNSNKCNEYLNEKCIQSLNLAVMRLFTFCFCTFVFVISSLLSFDVILKVHYFNSFSLFK